MNCSCSHPYADHVLTPLARDVYSKCSHCECSALLPVRAASTFTTSEPCMELCFICNGLIHPGAPRRPVHRETEDGPLRVGSLHPAEMNCQPPLPRTGEAPIDLGLVAFGAHTGAEEHWD